MSDIESVKNLVQKKYLAVGIFILVIIFLGSMLLCLSTGKPRLVFDEYSKDLGEIQEGASPEVVFRYRNKGNKQLIVYELKGSCRCQDLKVTKSKIAPGEVGELHTKVIPESTGGPATDIIRIKSNDYERPIQTVRVNRYVIKHTVIEPDKLIIKNLDSTHTDIRKVTVLGPTGNRDFRIVKAECDDERITADFNCLGSTDDNRSRWELKVTVRSKKAYNMKGTTMVSVSTSDTKKPTIMLPVIIEEDIPVRLTPNSLSLIMGGPPELQKAQIHVTCLSNIDYVNLQPDVNLPKYAKITLLSKKDNLSSRVWTFGVEIDDKVELETPGQMDKIEFSFPPLDISVFVPISVVKLKR